MTPNDKPGYVPNYYPLARTNKKAVRRNARMALAETAPMDRYDHDFTVWETELISGEPT